MKNGSEQLDLYPKQNKGFIKKELFDKAASELAQYKRQYKQLLDEGAQRRAEQERLIVELQSGREELYRRLKISDFKSRYISIGYNETLAAASAEALVNGDLDKVIAYQALQMSTYENAYRIRIDEEMRKFQRMSPGFAGYDGEARADGPTEAADTPNDPNTNS